jgi:hypothetical protein
MSLTKPDSRTGTSDGFGVSGITLSILNTVTGNFLGSGLGRKAHSVARTSGIEIRATLLGGVKAIQLHG